jgi:hypothetical protein
MHLDFALAQIEASGFEVYSPRTLSRGRVAQLFHNYIFASPINGTIWQSLRRVVGVTTVLSGVCPNAEIAALRSRTGPDGIIILPPPPMRKPLKPGTAIMVTGGPLAGLSGLHCRMTSNDRALVLLTFLGATRQVTVPASFVAAR